MKKDTPVNEFMAHLPVELDHSDSLKEAIDVMREKGIRHIPVMKFSKIFGVVSDRDIKFAIALMGKDADLTLENVCSENYIAVSPLTPVRKVAAEMYEHKIGSVLVKDGETLVGIFTTTDALRVLASI